MLLKIFLLCIGAAAVSSSAVLGGLMMGDRMAGVRLGTWLGEGEIDVEGVCSEPGFACQNCTHAVTCIPLPGGFLKVPLQECDLEQTCNANQGQCSNDHVPECKADTINYMHTCIQVGIFPDAHDCRKFHLCSPPEMGKPAEHRSALCPRHYGYDPQTAQCSIKLTKGHCSSKLVPECTSVGQHGVLTLSPHYYYVCLARKGHLHHQVFLCPYGWYFRENICRPEKKEEKADENETEEITNEEESGGDDGSMEEDESPNLSSAEEEVEETTTNADMERPYVGHVISVFFSISLLAFETGLQYRDFGIHPGIGVLFCLEYL